MCDNTVCKSSSWTTKQVVVASKDVYESVTFTKKESPVVKGSVTLQNSYQCGSGNTSVSITIRNYASSGETFTLTQPGNPNAQVPLGYYEIISVQATCGGNPMNDARVLESTSGTSSSFTVTESTPSVYVIVGK